MLNGIGPPERQELARVSDRFSFLYAECCTVHRENNAITFQDSEGIVHVPAAKLAALMLGPGTRITHAAMRVLGDCGVTIVWCGEKGIRYYAHGRSLSQSSRMAEIQAHLVSNQRTRLAVARSMYRLRFAGEDVSTLTMHQLRGREGARMKRIYKENSERTGVPWEGRVYDVDNYAGSDPINQALTSTHACLYGVVHAVIVSLGCVPSLGFVHNGKDRAFVYDIADLYKADISIPLAFDAVAYGESDVEGNSRRLFRDKAHKFKLLHRIVKDIAVLFDTEIDTEFTLADLTLWSEYGYTSAGRNYAEEVVLT
ncbi:MULTISPECIES: type I-E CRISPR-associated endonuclease Cas1e [unclassified Schaalia]|uniref:type I-E CRISPR-associated endonuclease Cas1e n=1 Tax=unclassified Schaalia TaxID=2691889 RepID=UPI001E31F5A5|nr:MULTISPECIES: type I-E CRISPR-associated endonuclease Cas1e [unclassified Schaalia]MCD4550385.1 type I-E CRISPR-associated endonuclease Cas1e [Schaalia sp. lx-260]MCD4556952.1 type I-E CRISPR-associated endonuclease Cas1e [Schaalia sp. lx-100]